MATPSPVPDPLSDLSARFRGELLQPTTVGFDDVRKVSNGLVDKRPALIARCRGVGDVIDALQHASRSGLLASIRAGGHNVAGRAVADGGVMIDLSLMRGVHVDPIARTARVEGGATWADYNRETQVHALASTGGIVGTTGVGGLTLGGGLGYLMGLHGLAIDNLKSVQLVAANGQVLTASKDENPDLFWALRGGGGNFGVATSFEFQVHPVGPTIMGGLVAHPFGQARDTLRFYRDVTASAPDALTAFAGLLCGPDGSKLAGIVAAHCGSESDARREVQPLKSWGPPVMDALGPMSYCQLNGMLDAGYAKGSLWYWKSNFLTELSDDAIDTVVDCYARCPVPTSQLLLEHFHGAACRVPASDTAFPHRSPGYNFLALGQWLNPADTDRCIAWTRETYAAMQPFMGSGRYVNYLGDDEGAESAASAYGSNYERLSRVKAQFDPDNVFRMNENIRPGR